MKLKSILAGAALAMTSGHGLRWLTTTKVGFVYVGPVGDMAAGPMSTIRGRRSG